MAVPPFSCSGFYGTSNAGVIMKTPHPMPRYAKIPRPYVILKSGGVLLCSQNASAFPKD